METDKVYRNRKLRLVATSLRKNMTRQEKRLWYDFLHNHPLHWYRQKALSYYIVDFYCAPAKLVVEIDGSQHYTEEGLAADNERTEVLECYGLKVIRFTNRDVDRNFQGVCAKIDEIVRERVKR